MKQKFLDILPYIIIVLVVVLIRAFIVTPVRVEGDSMKQSLLDNDILILYRLGKIERNDIVVLDEKMDNEVIIKRVIGMPNDTVEIKNKTIYINGEKQSDEFAYGETFPIKEEYTKVTLKEDEYFLLGDNRLISKDSRVFGPIKKSDIKGKIIFRLFPFNKIRTF